MFLNKEKNIFGIELNWKTISLLSFLAIFPNYLGVYHTTLFGLRIHFFQYLIFLAAIIYGPYGGAISGAFGSIYTAMSVNNPYILVGNIILGYFTGFFIKRYNFHAVSAVLTAYLIQAPWLWATDVYLAGMQIRYVSGIVVALLVSNFIWALGASVTAKKIKGIVQ